MSCNDAYILTGDTGGHIRVWDVGAGVDNGSAAACRASFVQVRGVVMVVVVG